MKKIAVKVCEKIIVASVSQDFFDEINSFMKENHYNSKAELARASIRKLLKGDKICEFIKNHFYGSKAELLREALRNFIKPEVQIVSSPVADHKVVEGRNNLKDIQAKIAEAKKWERLSIIPCSTKKLPFAYHPYRGREFAIAFATRTKAMNEMKNNPIFIKMKERAEA